MRCQPNRARFPASEIAFRVGSLHTRAMRATVRQAGSEIGVGVAAYVLTVGFLIAKGTKLHKVGTLTIEVWLALLLIVFVYNALRLLLWGHRNPDWLSDVESPTDSAVVFYLRHRYGSAHIAGLRCRVQPPDSDSWYEYTLPHSGPAAVQSCVYPTHFRGTSAVAGRYRFIWQERVGQDKWSELLRASANVKLGPSPPPGVKITIGLPPAKPAGQ